MSERALIDALETIEADRDRLADVVERVRALHQPRDIKTVSGRIQTVCSECFTGDPYVTVSNDYPCPTIEALNGEESL